MQSRIGKDKTIDEDCQGHYIQESLAESTRYSEEKENVRCLVGQFNELIIQC